MKPWIRVERIPGLLASAYIKATRLVIDSYYRPVAEEIVSSLDRGSILDLGTGPGYLPVEIARRAPAVTVVGVDLSRRLIREARSSAARAGLEHRLTFEVGDSARLRFEDASFDMVISTGMLHSLKDPVGVFREMHRVLKKGGRAWVFDPSNLGGTREREQWKASLGVHERLFLWVFTALKIHRPAKPLRLSTVRSIVEATDFKDYRIEDLKSEIRIKMRK